MERKTKHRILGTLVVAALIVVIAPFFQHGNDAPSTTALVKAPPFPDQSIQVSADEVTTSQAPAQIALNRANSEESETVNQQPDDTISATGHDNPQQVKEPSLVEQPSTNTEKSKVKELGTATSSEEQAKALPISGKPVKANTHNTKPPVKFAAAELTKKTKIKTAINSQLTNNNGLMDIKSAAWVVQMGSFKNKGNALRLVNQLRANGYHAFIQKIATTFGENTRVFVGPEIKKDSARALADRLETDMKLHGIVISYKPLTL